MAQGSPKDDLSFGQVAVEKGYLNEAQVREALEIQSKLRAMGVRAKRLGEILLERSYLTHEQTEDILATQRKLESRRRIPGYEILGELGRGGMGTVYRAVQKSMNRTVALKVLSPRHARNRSFIERFMREARAVAKLNHENIIAGIDVGEANGLFYFAMEYVEGETVVEMIQRKGALPEKRAIDIVLQVAKALDHANRHNLVHRDIKPQNIIVTMKGIAKLCDLGLAKTEDSEAHITRTGVSMGTPHYISPEQAKGLGDVDIRSDIYSLGATLYHMVVGEVPFVGSGPLIVMTKHITEEPPFPSDRNPEVSAGLSEVICKMMAKQVEQRYQTPSELIMDLGRVAEGLPPVIAGRRPGSRRMAREPRRGSGRMPVRRGARRGRGGGRSERSELGRGSSPVGYGRLPGRSSSMRHYMHHENVMLGVFIFAVILVFAFALLMGYVSSGREIIRTIEKNYPKYEADARENAASRALGEARQFDKANPYEDKEIVAQKYLEVSSKYSGTEAAREAQQMYGEVMQRRK
jgi:hypothetical protein